MKERSDSSVLYAHRPSRCASGAKICSVSRAVAALRGQETEGGLQEMCRFTGGLQEIAGESAGE